MLRQALEPVSLEAITSDGDLWGRLNKVTATALELEARRARGVADLDAQLAACGAAQ